jgi:hypothetical protein
MKKLFLVMAALLAGVTMVLILSSCPNPTANGGGTQMPPDGILYVSTGGGNDSNDGTKEKPLATIQAAISIRMGSLRETVEIRVTEGTYYVVDSGLILKDTSLVGGYATNFSERNPLTHTTKIEDTRVIGTMNIAIYMRNSSLDGFNVQAASGGDQTRALDCYSPCVIANCTIDGGTGGQAGAIACTGPEIEIKNNSIYGGKSTQEFSVAIAAFSCSSDTKIENNVIDGGEGPKGASGIGTEDCSSVFIENNTIFGGKDTNGGSGDTWGIHNAGSSPVIRGNMITGGTGSYYSTGIVNIENSTPIIRNNIIYGGQAQTDVAGINYIKSGGLLQNNTISSGSANNAWGILISANSCPLIHNNIIFTSGGTLSRGCIALLDSSRPYSYPHALLNNNLWGLGGAILLTDNRSSTNYTTVNEINALPYASGNVSLDPLLVNANGPDGDIGTMGDNDWHLTDSSPSDVRQGGIDCVAAGWTDFTTDKDGNTRTNIIQEPPPSNSGAGGWSMGAYERD